MTSFTASVLAVSLVLHAADAPTAEPKPSPFHWSTARLTGVGAMVGGAVLLAAAGAYALDTMTLQSRREKLCPGNPCREPTAFTTYDQARNAQQTGILLAAIGGGLAVLGLLVFLINPFGDAKLEASASLLPGQAGLLVRGAF